MFKLPVTYELKEGKEIRQLPVHVVDVDSFFIWLMVERDPNTQWNVGVAWSRIVGELLKAPIEELKEEYAEVGRLRIDYWVNKHGRQLSMF